MSNPRTTNLGLNLSQPGNNPDAMTRWPGLIDDNFHKIDDAAVRRAVLALSSAQILALHSTPLEIVPAPGVGKIILPISAVIQYFAGATPYTVNAGDTFMLLPEGAASIGFGYQADATGLIDQAINQIGNFGPTEISSSLSSASGKGLSVAESDGGTPFSGGDGTVKITVLYVVVDL